MAPQKARDRAVRSLTVLQAPSQELRRSAALWGIDHPEAMGAVGPLCKELLDLVGLLKEVRTSLESQPADDSSNTRLDSLADMLEAFSVPVISMHETMEQQSLSGDGMAGDLSSERLEKFCASIGEIKRTLQVFTRFLALAAEVEEIASSMPQSEGANTTGSVRQFLRGLFSRSSGASEAVPPSQTLTPPSPSIARKPVRTATSRKDASAQTTDPYPSALQRQETETIQTRSMETMAAVDLGAEIKILRRGGRPETAEAEQQLTENSVPSPAPEPKKDHEKITLVSRKDTQTSTVEEKDPVPAYVESSVMMVHPITGTLLPAYETVESTVDTRQPETVASITSEAKVPFTSVYTEQTVSTDAPKPGGSAPTETSEAITEPTKTSAGWKVTYKVEASSSGGGSADATGNSQSSTVKRKPVSSSSQGSSQPQDLPPPYTNEGTTSFDMMHLKTQLELAKTPRDVFKVIIKLWKAEKFAEAIQACHDVFKLSTTRWTTTQVLELRGCRAVAYQLEDPTSQSALDGWQAVRRELEASLQFGKSHFMTTRAIIQIGLWNERKGQVYAAKSYYNQAIKLSNKYLRSAEETDSYFSAWFQSLSLDYSHGKPSDVMAVLASFTKELQQAWQFKRSSDPDSFDGFFRVFGEYGVRVADTKSETVVFRLFDLACCANIRPLVAAYLDRLPHLMWTDKVRVNALCAASAYGACDVITLLLDRGMDVDERETDGFTGLQNAACENKISAARILVGNGADINTTCDTGSTPLINAIRNKHKAMANSLIMLGASFKAPKGKPWTPLIVAVSDGLPEMVDLLLSKGAPLEDPDVTKGQAIHSAAMEEKCTDEILLKLIRAGDAACMKIIDSPINSPDDPSYDRSTPLQLAVIMKRKSRVKLLLEHGANVNHRNAENGTAVYYAAQVYDVETLAMLVKRGANLNARISAGSTSLNLFANAGELDSVVCLVQAGADINLADNGGMTPLINAVRNEKAELVAYLLDCGADVNIADNNAWSPVMLAATRGNTKILQNLINHGGDVNAQNKYGFSALHIVTHKKLKEAFDLLIKHGAAVTTSSTEGLTPLMTALYNTDEESKAMAQTILSKIFEEKDTDKIHEYLNSRHLELGYTALNYAAEAGNNSAIRQMHREIDINVRETSRGFAPLTHAADNGHLSTCELLISLGAKIFVDDPFSGGPLGRAIRKKHFDVVKLLVKSDPTLLPSMNVSENMAFLDTDELDTNVEILEFLLQNGADPNQLDPYGCTPLHWARINRRENHLQVVRLLQSYGGVDQGGSFESTLKGFQSRLDIFEKNFQWNKNRKHFKTFLKWMDVACSLSHIGYYEEAIIAAEQTLEFEFEENKDDTTGAFPKRRVLFEGKTNRSFSWICQSCDKLMGLDTAARFYICKSCSDFTMCKTCYDTNMPAWEKRNNHEYLEVPRQKWYTLQEDVVDVDRENRSFTQEAWLARIRQIKEPPPGFSPF